MGGVYGRRHRESWVIVDLLVFGWFDGCVGCLGSQAESKAAKSLQSLENLKL